MDCRWSWSNQGITQGFGVQVTSLLAFQFLVALVCASTLLGSLELAKFGPCTLYVVWVQPSVCQVWALQALCWSVFMLWLLLVAWWHLLIVVRPFSACIGPILAVACLVLPRCLGIYYTIYITVSTCLGCGLRQNSYHQCYVSRKVI